MFIKNLKNKKIFSSKKENVPIVASKEKEEKHFPSAIREWKNSIYVYNENTLKLIPYAEKLALKIIKGYFSIYDKRLEKLTRTKRLLNRFRKYSSNKIYISQGEFKHTNNKVLINLYLYNRKKNNYISYLKNWYTKYLNKNLNIIFINRLKIINKKGLINLKKANENKILILKALNNINNNVNYGKIYKNISNYLNTFYKTSVNKTIRKIKIFYYYKQLLHTNKNILNYNFLQYLQKHIESIYNKNIEFNLINLKRFFLNSDILSDSITLKISNNRRKLLGFLNNLKSKVKVHKKKAYLGKLFTKKDLNIKHIMNNDKTMLENYIIYNLKYKRVTGFRIESKGRLTRRYTASRSISKTKYKGNLLDLDSSYRGLSTVLLRGNLKSNLQFSKLKSKTRIGSFGIKGWVSGN